MRTPLPPTNVSWEIFYTENMYGNHVVVEKKRTEITRLIVRVRQNRFGCTEPDSVMLTNACSRIE